NRSDVTTISAFASSPFSGNQREAEGRLRQALGRCPTADDRDQPEPADYRRGRPRPRRSLQLCSCARLIATGGPPSLPAAVRERPISESALTAKPYTNVISRLSCRSPLLVATVASSSAQPKSIAMKHLRPHECGRRHPAAHTGARKAKFMRILVF